MADPVVPTAAEVPASPSPAAPEPKLMENIRADMAAHDEAEAPAPVIPAEGAVPPAVPPTTAEKQEAIAEALPSLSDEQVKQLAENPKIVEAVFGGSTGGKTLETLFQEMIQGHDAEVAKTAEQRKFAATIEEALKEGQEGGDWGSFGKLMADKIAEQNQLVAAAEGQEAIRGESMRAVLNDLDTAVEEVYGDVLDTFSEEDIGKLARANFPTDAAFMAGVLKAFDTKRQEMVRSSTGTEVAGQLSATAAETAAAAAKARSAVGIGALPGGSSEESLGTDVGLLIRQGMQGAFDGVEE